jgi:hypothetical protein
LFHQPGEVFDNPFGDHMDGVADAGFTQSLGSSIMGAAHGLGLVDAEDWWIAEVGKAIEQLLRKIDPPPLDADVCQWLDDPDEALMTWLSPEEAEFFDAARTLGCSSPKALAHVLVYWRRRALGYAAPDWEGA